MAKFCGKCGAQMEDTAAFCPKCGEKNQPSAPETTPSSTPAAEQTPTPSVTPTTPAPSKADKKRLKKEAKAQKKANLTGKQKFTRFLIKALCILLALTIVVGSGSCALVYFKVVDIPFLSNLMQTLGIMEKESDSPSSAPSSSQPTPSQPESSTPDSSDLPSSYPTSDYPSSRVDADEYFQDNTDLKTVIDVATSSSISTEQATYQNFVARGFADCSITYDYTIEGKLIDTCEIDPTSLVKHPIYGCQYTTQNGDLWYIVEINGSVFATPLTYAYENPNQPTILLSETNTITGYDSTANKFYVHIPNPSENAVKTVPQINAATLESLTSKELDLL